MVLYTIPLLYTDEGFTPFLNTMLKAMDRIPFLGVSFYAMFSFYLLACVVKGITKVGMKLFFISIHPLKYVSDKLTLLVSATRTWTQCYSTLE
jgi:LMBR1 domain-containing protein 1